jgi:Fe-S cluster assembly protein SufD
MNMPIRSTTAEAAYLQAGEAMAISPARRAAFERFMATGLPHRRMEDWRWTDLKQLLARPFPPAKPAIADARTVQRLVALSPFEGVPRARLVIADGVYRPELSELPLTGGIAVTALAEPSPIDGSDPLLLLNTAFFSGGVRIEVAVGENVTLPVEVLSVNSGAQAESFAPRLEIALGDGAALTLVETHLGADGSYVVLPLTLARLGAGSRLDRIKVQEDAARAYHLANAHIDLGADSTLRDFTFTIGAAVTRNQGFVTFSGEGGDARVTGSYLLHDRQHCDTRLVIDHAVPRCTSREIFKCVVDEEARGIFQGKVIVRPDAQKTDGKQSSHALLLSPTAEFDAKPELEIFADDVVCGHGATAGDLDEDHVFYLRSRGIPEDRARSMLITAFIAESFDDVADERLRDSLAARGEGWLDRRRLTAEAAAGNGSDG